MQHLQSHIVQAMPLHTYLARSRNQIGAFVSELDEEGRSDQHVVLRFDLSPDRELVELLAVDFIGVYIRYQYAYVEPGARFGLSHGDRCIVVVGEQ